MDDWAKGLIGGAVVGKDEEVRVDVIEKNSGVKFLPEDRAALLHKPILAVWDQSSWDQSSWGQQLAPPLTVPSKER